MGRDGASQPGYSSRVSQRREGERAVHPERDVHPKAPSVLQRAHSEVGPRH